ncbi:hypothetical protein Micbo1qcDRAFT_166466 [Microdochium bolleyi]|uniref:BZIP domain-containing protein n=1 Tax=Microdochium bolleyi TaxID=196109 RepID=A0A136IUD3_9PEZI|nr:hypothetical protein Micbo1qcDRAFT_166466 [Microdochium bolleyi]
MDDDVKRTRGRPRLQTTDQTASERRRTQIRLAQRAYRSRKETAMNDLEGQVKRLKDSNAEIREAIQELADCAGRYSNLINQMPELAEHLEKVRELTRRRKHSLQTEGSESEDGNNRNIQDDAEAVIKSEETLDSPSSPITKVKSQPQHLVDDTMNTYGAGAGPSQHLQSHPFAAFQDHTASEYEVIAVPTTDNASFAPSKIDLNASFLHGISWTAQSHLGEFSVPQAGSLPVSGFGRRLHQHAKAKTAALINTSPPPTESLLHAFGFLSLFEPLEQARTRVNNELQQSHNAMMYGMQFPYFSDNGTASHFQNRDQQGHPPSSSQYPSDATYRSETSANQMCELRGKLFEICKTAHLPLSRIAIWDCDEVDSYLRQRGVDLSGAADSCTIQLHALSIPHPDSHDHQQRGSGYIVDDHGGANGAPYELTQSPWDGLSTSTFGGPLPPPDISSLPQADLKVFAVDINKFLENLTSQTICLGRTVAFRPNDVNRAFWDAVSG